MEDVWENAHMYTGYDQLENTNYTCKYIGDVIYDHIHQWLMSGKLHNKHGPAIECINGYKAYYIYDVEYSFEEYQIEISRMNTPLPSKHTEEICLITLEQLHMGDRYDECPNHHVSICDENKGIYKEICPYCKQKYIGRFVQV